MKTLTPAFGSAEGEQPERERKRSLVSTADTQSLNEGGLQQDHGRGGKRPR